MKAWLFKMLESEQQEVVQFALQGAVRSGIDDDTLFEMILKKIDHFQDNIPIHDIGFMLHPTYRTGEKNYRTLLNHFHQLPQGERSDDYFSILYLYGYYHYDPTLFLKLVNEDEQYALKGFLSDFEKIGHYALDELFLQLFNILVDSEEKRFYQLNHCYLEMIIAHILKFPHIEIVRYLENGFKEEQLTFYMVGYLFYITSFLKEDSLLPYLKHYIDVYPDIQDILLRRFFHLWPQNQLLKKLIDQDCDYLSYLVCFPEDVLEGYFNNIMIHQSEKGGIAFAEVAALTGNFHWIDQLIDQKIISRESVEFPLDLLKALQN